MSSNPIIPKVRETVRHSIVKAVEFDGGAMQSCLSCKRFDEPGELCEKYLGRPPARVIAYGCNGYEDVNDIPF